MRSKLGHKLPCRRKSYLNCLRASPFRLTHAQLRFTGDFLRFPVEFLRFLLISNSFLLISRFADTRFADDALERVRHARAHPLGCLCVAFYKNQALERKTLKTTPL
jgi:hypothetical protein